MVVSIVNSGEVGDVVTSRRLPTITNALYFELFLQPKRAKYRITLAIVGSLLEVTTSPTSPELTITAGQRNDITQAENLTKDVQNTTVIGDKGYDSSAFVES